MIKNLLKEQEELRKRLAARGLTQQRKDSKDLQALLKQNETLDREIAEEKQRQKQLQMEVFFLIFFVVVYLGFWAHKPV